jgi:hypothetical protein
MGRAGLALGSDARPDDAVPVMLPNEGRTSVMPAASARVNTAASGRCGHSVRVEGLLAGEGQVTSAAMARLTASLHP